MPVWIGTSGWQYRDWRGAFYPEKLRTADWLHHYVERFDVVEVNNTFYMLPKREVFAHWRAALPSRFLMVCKLSRYLTHVKRLRDPEEPVQRFLEHAAPLGDRMGPLLLQLPPRMPVDLDRLGWALQQFPDGVRVAVEVRDASWHTVATDALLAERGAALVLTDRLGEPLEPVRRTAAWGYIRLHEGAGPRPPCYDERSLRRWVERIAQLFTAADDVFVFFNNDPHCCAVRDAVRFATLAREAGLPTSRVPAADEVRLAR